MILSDPEIIHIDAPLDANVWKIQVKQGDILTAGQAAIVLEAMKLEITVSIPQDVGKVKVEKLLANQGTTVQAGARLLLLRPVEI